MSNTINKIIKRVQWFANSTKQTVQNEIEYNKKLVETYQTISFDSIKSADVLEIGHGTIPCQGVLINSRCNSYTGIDVDLSLETFFTDLVKLIKDQGIERALKRYLRHILIDNKIKKKITRHIKDKKAFHNLNTISMDATATTFKNSSFDLIFSRAVFEHIDGVEKCVKEINRLLKKDGIAIIEIHLFPSLSGGHNVEWQFPDTNPDKIIPPWDHLREQKFIPPGVFLNKLKMEDYNKIFKSMLNIIETKTTSEGLNILTENLLEELSKKGYSKEDLTTRTVTIISRKSNKK